MKGVSSSTGHNWRFVDLAGQKFGKLSVQRFIGYKNGKSAVWECVCDCGNVIQVLGVRLRIGKTKSCGCFRRETTRETMTTHGKSKTKTYMRWAGMIDRCYRPNNSQFKYYGERGVKVCSRWRSFENFLKDLGECPPGLTIERNDPNGNYEPNNCRWATPREQANNKRNSKKLTIKGRTMTQAMWSRETGINQSTIYQRLKRGLTAEQALTI